MHDIIIKYLKMPTWNREAYERRTGLRLEEVPERCVVTLKDDANRPAVAFIHRYLRKHFADVLVAAAAAVNPAGTAEVERPLELNAGDVDVGRDLVDVDPLRTFAAAAASDVAVASPHLANEVLEPVGRHLPPVEDEVVEQVDAGVVFHREEVERQRSTSASGEIAVGVRRRRGVECAELALGELDVEEDLVEDAPTSASDVALDVIGEVVEDRLDGETVRVTYTHGYNMSLLA